MELYTRPGQLEIVNESMNKSEAEYLNEPSFKVQLIAHPDLVQLFAKYGITRRGRYTWSLHNNGVVNSETFKDFYKEYSEKFTPYTLHANNTDGNASAMVSGYYLNNVYSIAQPLAMSSAMLPTLNTQRAVSTHTRPFFGEMTIHDLDNDFLNETLINNEYKQALLSGGQENQLYVKNFNFKNKIVQENFSPFIITMNLKNDTLYFRLKLIHSDYMRVGEYHNQQTSMAFPDKVCGIAYDVMTPDTYMLNISEISKLIAETKTLFNNTVFTKESKNVAEQISKTIENKIFVNSVPGKPSNVKVMNATSRPLSLLVSKFKKNGDKSVRPKRNIKIGKYSEVALTLNEALDLGESNQNYKLMVHPSLIDAQNMINAKDYMGEDRLYAYQRKAVGLQLSTERGFLNSLDTGIGKSIVQLTSMRERSKTIENYRGLIVCQSNTKRQWKEYAIDDAWFPEAEVVIVDSGKSVQKLVDGLSKTGPVVVIATFNMVAQISEILEEREIIRDTINNLSKDAAMYFLKNKQEEAKTAELVIGDLFVDAHWDDICADEATSIRNSTSSNQAKALWHLRGNSDRGVALTATPFNKSIDDIARLLEWVRNEKHMFYGNKLSKLYDQENITEKNAKEIFDSLYPMVFRFTKEEAQEQEKEKIKIPKELAPETLLLKPSPAELALSNACEYELKRIIGELETALDNYEAKSDDEKAEVDAARDELKEAHGHWMAGTNVARMATSDPASIMKSKSVAAQLLIGQGLVQNAMMDTPTKRKVLLKRVSKHVELGKQILVFTDFVPVAGALVEAFESIGIRAGVFGGSNLKQREVNRIAFQNSELDVLVCTKAAERGLTLHKASVVYHYDMSWTLEPLLQKSGRAARVGSQNETVETYFLILEGTIEEKVVDKVFSQGTMSSMVLDNARGVDIKKTTTGKLMGGLMKASSNIHSRKGAVDFGKALLGV